MSVQTAIAATAFTIVAIAAALPAAADLAKDSIDARRGFFTLLGVETGPLAAMAKGEIDYDPEQARRHAGNLQALATYTFPDLFVAGSSNADHPGSTRAQPEIWADGSTFAAKAQGLRDAVASLQSVAAEGRAALGGGVGALGASCTACHRAYRAREF